MPPLAESNPLALFLFVAAALVAAMVLSRSRRQIREASSSFSGGRPLSLARPAAEKPAEVTQWEVEALERVRGFSATLDNKIVLLQQLIIEARHQADLLARLLTELRDARTGDVQTSSAAPVAAAAPAPVESRAALTAAAAEELLAGDEPEAGSSAPHWPRAEVEALAAAGRSAAEIAQRLALPQGEVELMLNLRRNYLPPNEQETEQPRSPSADWGARDSYLPGV